MEQGGGFNMTSFRGAPLRHCEAELFRSRWIRFFGRTAFGAAIQIYRYIRGSAHATAALAPGSLPIPVYRCPNVLACRRSSYASLPERLTPPKKKRPARRGLAGYGGDSEAALVRGDRLRVMGMRLTGGDWPFGVASFHGYAIDCQRSVSFVVRAQAANSWRNDLD